jgi:hypothetical protein
MKKRLKIEEFFASLRDIRRQDDNWDKSETSAVLEDEFFELNEQPRRIVSSSWAESTAASVGPPHCPHNGCREAITFTQNAAGRQVAVCAVHGVVRPAQEQVHSEGRHWGDNYSVAPWQPGELWERSRRRAPAVGAFGMQVVRAKKPAPKPRYEVPLDPLDYG